MKKIKKRIGRTLGVLFALFVIFNIYYFFTWTKAPDRSKEQITTVVQDPAFAKSIPGQPTT